MFVGVAVCGAWEADASLLGVSPIEFFLATAYKLAARLPISQQSPEVLDTFF